TLKTLLAAGRRGAGWLVPSRRCRHARTLHTTRVDPRRPVTRERPGLQLGADGGGPPQAVAGGRRGVRLRPSAEGDDGPLPLEREALGDLMVGQRHVVQAREARLQVAATPLAEPELGAAVGGADGLDGSAGETQGNGSMTCREFVVHGDLHEAAAGGWP